MDNLFSTHPNTENRIAELEEMARESGQTAPAARWRAPHSATPVRGRSERRAHASRSVGLGEWRPGVRVPHEPRRGPPREKSKPVVAPCRLGLPAREAAVRLMPAVLSKGHSSMTAP